jgi:hypothetical protein
MTEEILFKRRMFKLFTNESKKKFLSFAAKKVCHEGTKARSRKMLRIFLSALVPLWLNSIFVKKLFFSILKHR